MKIAFLLLAGASCLFFFRIGRNSLWTDELETAEVVHYHSQHDLWNPANPAKMEEYFSHGFLAPYYSITRVWAGIFGDSEAGLRSLSAISAILALGMILFLGPTQWGLGWRVSLIAGALFAFSPMMLWYAQEARYYGLLQVFTLLACWFYLKHLETQKGRWLAGWALISILAMMTHPFMVFIVGAQGLYGLWLWKKTGFSKAARFLACHGIAAAGFLSLYKPLSISSSRISAVEAFSLPTDELIPWRVLASYLCGIYEHPSPFLAWLLVLGATATIVLQVREAMIETKTRTDAPMFWMVTALGGCAFMTVVSMIRPIMVEGKKYEIIFLAPFCVVLARGLWMTKWPRWSVSLFLGVMALNAVMVDLDYFTKPQKQNWKLAGDLVEHQAKPGDVWIHQSLWREYAAEYYSPGASKVLKNVLWKPSHLAGPPPTALKNARRVWLVKTGGIADSYGTRLEQEGFRKTEYVLPSGTYFMTELWLFEKGSP